MSSSDQRTDLELVAAANDGDAPAFEAIYERYRDWVIGLAFRFTHHRDAALDVMQDTFMYLLRKFPGFALTAQFKTFLYPVVRHNALALARKQNSNRASDFSREPMTMTAPPLELQPLHEAMQSLDSGHREVIILRFMEELSIQEIARAMELPLGTVKSRLHHALAQLRTNSKLRKFFQEP